MAKITRYLESTESNDVELYTRSFFSLIETNLDDWEKDLETKKGNTICSFKGLFDLITKERELCKTDVCGDIGSSKKTTFNIQRAHALFKHDYITLMGSICKFLEKNYSSYDEYSKSLKKVSDAFEDFEDELNKLMADKITVNFTYMLEEFEDLMKSYENIVSTSKSSKGENIRKILSLLSTYLDLSIAIILDDDSAPEEIAFEQKKIKAGKGYISKFVSTTKSAVGQLHGIICTELNRESPDKS